MAQPNYYDIRLKPNGRIESQFIIAKGKDGRVFKALKFHEDSDNRTSDVALKIIELDLSPDGTANVKEIDKHVTADSKEELHIRLDSLLKLSHPNVVDHFAMGYCDRSNLLHLPYYYLVMEFCKGGNLHEAVKNNRVNAHRIRTWTRDILEGLCYLYEERIIHRDMKSGNILLTSQNISKANLKIADFCDIHRLVSRKTRKDEVSGRGTYPFRSPESIRESTEDANFGRKSDIWSLGCIILQMITGHAPRFIKENGIEIFGEIPVCFYVGSGGMPSIPDNLPKPFATLLSNCICVCPNKRHAASDLLKDPFIVAAEHEIDEWVYDRPL